ncbi:LANO_0B03378g1_1 [Lachancea nothofagi CBS 11611]|uniref:LANO_0B03378g1_1 n=1 Tax=Lachancea nothofagi CBS 11611 TaxID=1266666 RepID=A0A1G4IXB3_9SACH|nr:LANO_0B03378g1_1 [Lachancea nothofagi CBS 11611]
MDTVKENSLLTRFTRIRKKPQQPLTDLTELYSRLANESIYYLKLEEKQEYRKAVLGWKALNTHVLYELTQIEHQYPNSQNYTKDELSIQNGVRDLFHRSLQHLERASKLLQDSESGTDAIMKQETTFARRPVPPAGNSRSMLKTLRDPKLQYNRNHTASAPSITTNSSRSNSNNEKINFTTSKPLKHNNAFQGFDEVQNLIDFSDNDGESVESAPRLEEDAKSDQTFEFDVQDYFDDYLDMDQEELKRLEAFNSLEGVQKNMHTLSMNTESLNPKGKEPHLKITQSTPALSQENPTLRYAKPSTPKPSPKIISKATPRMAAKPTTQPIAPRKLQKKPVSEPTTKSRPIGRPSQSASEIRSRVASPPSKEPPIVNKRVIRTTKPIVRTKTPESKVNNGEGKKPQLPRVNGSSKSSKQAGTADVPRKKVLKPTVPSSDKPEEDNSVEETKPIDEKSLKEALEDDIIDQLRGVDKTAAKQIFSEIVVRGDQVHWEDIAGLEAAKNSLKEAVVYPFLRPDLFRGLREPVRGMLLFGPPGTGKTMLARAVATESNSTFFSISASSLTSKYLGESEKLVRALFAIAKKLSPSIIFVDEIDSLMGSRNNDGENESSRRIKNEFLVQWSSLSSAAAGNKSSSGENGTDDDNEEDERVLVLAATNLPWSIDEAARRRFVRRQYIPLPETETRRKQLTKLLAHQTHTLTEEDFSALLDLTNGYSGSDITSLAKDAAMGPLRELGDKLLFTPRDQIRAITLQDVKNSLSYIKPSVSSEGLEQYEDWANKFGSSGV